MTATRVLVAYASQTGSTAGIAKVICAELQRAGLTVDCRQASEVDDLGSYGAVILGSGVFLAKRSSDGGGFLTRHAAALRTRHVWLFTAGPIGRPSAGDDSDGHSAVMDVAGRIGADGATTFGALRPADGPDPLQHLQSVDRTRVRAWARAIAAVLTRHAQAASARSSVAAVC